MEFRFNLLMEMEKADLSKELIRIMQTYELVFSKLGVEGR